MPRPVCITYDSTCDLTPQLLERFHIRTIPLTIQSGGRVFPDDGNYTSAELYTDYRRNGTLPKTTAISPEAFKVFFSPLLAEGYDIVHIDISAELSCTCQNAVLAAQELTERDRLKGRARSNEELAEYAQRQRISCVLVLNDALEPVYSCGVDMDWSDLYTNESVSNVMQYPEKIFARRLTRDGVVYDVAAAARTVEPGMVFCVRRQSSAVIASYHASIESLLAGYETLLNEKIYTYITDGEKVIGSSDNGQWNLPVDSVPLITALEQADSDEVRLWRYVFRYA